MGWDGWEVQGYRRAAYWTASVLARLEDELRFNVPVYFGFDDATYAACRLLEILANGFFLLFYGTFYFYYLPDDLRHYTSVQVVPSNS